jgi:hypothetical protein
MVVRIKRLFNDAEAFAGHRAKSMEQSDKKLYALCPMLYSASINNFEIIFCHKIQKNIF